MARYIQEVTYLVQHEALAVEVDADPFGVAVNNWVSNLQTSVRGMKAVSRRGCAHTNLLHVTVAAPISKLSADREVVEIMGPEVFARSGS